MKKIICFMLILMVLLLYGCAQKAAEEQGASTVTSGQSTVDIEIKGFAFNPATITITKGTTVIWTQKDSVQHTVTSDNGVFESGLLSKGQTYSHTFNDAGTFEYHCSPHPSMKGKIVVE